MIITCEQCQAQFQLPDERLPQKGARVRCSKCKHAFFVAHPGSSAESSAPSQTPLAAERARTVAQPAAASKPQASASRVPVVAASPDREDEVGDWGFNEDAKAKSGSFGKPKVNLDSELFEEPNPDLRDAVSAVAEEGSFFGESSESSEFDSNLGSVPEETSSAATSTEDLHSDFSDLFSEAKAATSQEHETPESAESTSSEGAEAVDDWDFFGDAEKKASPTSVAAHGMDVFLDSIAQNVDRPVQKSFTANVAPVEALPQSPKKKADSLPPWFEFASTVAGWCIVGVLILIIVFERMTPASTFVAPEEGSLKVGALVADGVHGHAIENSVSGMIYVVSGQLQNDAATPASAGSAIRVVLVDEKGNAVADTAPAMAGFALTTHQLREEKADELRQKLEADAAHLAWTDLKSKESLQFEAIFPKMPEGAVGFRLETVDVAKPSSRPLVTETRDSVEDVTSNGVDAALDAAGSTDGADGSGALEGDGQSPTPGSDDASSQQPLSIPGGDQAPGDAGAAPLPANPGDSAPSPSIP